METGAIVGIVIPCVLIAIFVIVYFWYQNSGRSGRKTVHEANDSDFQTTDYTKPGYYNAYLDGNQYKPIGDM